MEEIGYPNLAEQATEKTKVEALGLASKVRQKGAKMTTEHQSTQLEEAYGQLLDQIWEVLSEPARTVLKEAQSAAYAENMVHNYCYHPEEYDEAMKKMRLAAAELPNAEHGLLAKVWRCPGRCHLYRRRRLRDTRRTQSVLGKSSLVLQDAIRHGRRDLIGEDAGENGGGAPEGPSGAGTGRPVGYPVLR